jgi:hypothetical protein
LVTKDFIMSDLLLRARKARAVANEPSLPKWERAMLALKAFGGLDLNGLSREVRDTLEQHLVEVNRVLDKYRWRRMTTTSA